MLSTAKREPPILKPHFEVSDHVAYVSLRTETRAEVQNTTIVSLNYNLDFKVCLRFPPMDMYSQDAIIYFYHTDFIAFLLDWSTLETMHI